MENGSMSGVVPNEPQRSLQYLLENSESAREIVV